MSVLTTEHGRKVALYDDTTDWAFGPVFDNEYEAEDFLLFADRWIREHTHTSGDVRTLAPKALEECYGAWEKERRDPESGEIVLPDESGGSTDASRGRGFARGG